MKYLADDKWERLPINDFRARFFVETFTEKLSMRTPHFYQSRLMNIFSSSLEALTYISEYRSNDKNGGYILSSLDEIDSCLSNDPVAEFLFAKMEGSRQQIFKKIRGGDFSSGQLNRLSVICRGVLAREEDYEKELLADLNKVLFSNVELAQKDRLTTSIYALTGLYVTHLLNKGYSPTYLFNRAEQFTRETNYSGRNFKEQFEFITEKLRSHTTSFEVYFAIRSNKPSSLLAINDEDNCKFFSTIPDDIQDNKLKKSWAELNPNAIARLTITSTDFVSASWRTKDKLDQLIDAVTALELNPQIAFHPHCMAISRNQQFTHGESLNISLLIGFLTSESGTFFTKSDNTIRHALAKLNIEGKEHIGRSLRYLRLARESVSLEQKLLNLWIALESLFSDGENSILLNIVEYVPQIYALTGLQRRIEYLRDALVRHQIPITPLALSITKGDAVFNEESTSSIVFEVLKNKDASIELFNSLGPKEHLKFRFYSTFMDMKDNKSLADRVKRSETDVARQLRRIYFLRNKITHTGHFANIRPQLITHLLDYLAVSYVAISKAAIQTKNDRLHSISDLLVAYKMGAEAVVSNINSSTAINTFEEIVPTPLI
ncbi:hypothetical protein [Janthinobacterium sp. 17J80-10]|uniref:hypothetical protein n=1 Tax=Janthinobacterium sp. 17J80-10 TaxID=2497863 RepID=UPI0010058A86|nr:hypothetical protein [Janthinobacterium sp. 17J80-10]QAU33756.1 hypothetical protein EKL02_05915 [Janthinobacterium sp. 17J80-10]